MSTLTLEQRIDRAPQKVKRQIGRFLDAPTPQQQELADILSEINRGTPRGKFLAGLIHLGLAVSKPITQWPAFSEQDDLNAVVDVLTQPGVLEKSLPEVDPLMVYRLKGTVLKQELLKDQGLPPFSSEQVAENLGMSREAVNKRRRKGQLVAVSVGKRGYQYPAWQFQDGQVLRGLREVLQALGSVGEWTPILFLCSGDPMLDGETPLERLKQGDIDAAIAAAQRYGKANPS